MKRSLEFQGQKYISIANTVTAHGTKNMWSYIAGGLKIKVI